MKSSMDYTALLPAETLCCVFSWARRANPIPDVDASTEREDVYGAPARIAYHLAWVSVTHVCSRWRSTALNDATLWTVVPTTLSLQAMQTFVERSQTAAPLLVDWKSLKHTMSDNPMFSWLYESVVPSHRERLGNVAIDLNRDEDMIAILDRPWPLLEDLSVTYRDIRISPDTFLDDRFPRLRVFSWSGDFVWAFPWQDAGLRYLTRLSINFVLRWIMKGEDMGTLLDALRHMPDLRELRLNLGDPLHSENVPCYACNPTTRVQKTALDVLTISGDAGELDHVMRHLVLPPTARLWLNIYDAAQWPDTTKNTPMRNLCIQAGSWLRSTSTAPTFLTAQIIELPYWQIQIRLSRSPVFPQSPASSLEDWVRSAEDPNIDIAINCVVEDEVDYDWAIEAVLSELAPEGIRALSLQFESSETLLYLIEKSRILCDPSLQNVELLRIPSDGASAYLNSVVAPPEDDGDSSEEEPSPEEKKKKLTPLPNLKFLAVHEMSLIELRHLVESGEADNGMEFEENSLQTFLDARRTAGVPVQVVYIDAAEDVSDAYAELREMDDVTETEIEEVEEAIETLKAIPEVRFISEKDGALYAEDFWKAMMD